MSVGADSNAANKKVGELLSHQRMMGEAKVIFAEAKASACSCSSTAMPFWNFVNSARGGGRNDESGVRQSKMQSWMRDSGREWLELFA